MNRVDSYLKAVGSAQAHEIMAEAGIPHCECYARLVALEGAGKVRLSVAFEYQGQSRPKITWEWME